MKTKAPAIKLLLYDIENAYLIGASWDVWETNIIEVLQPPYILSVSWKWLGEKETHFLGLPDFHGYRKYKPEDEEKLVTAFHKIMEQADFLCGHNSNSFDFKKLNAAFLKYQLPPIKPVKMIDTLKAARQIAKFPSNKLDDLGSALGLGRKLAHTGKHLWTACMNGDRNAWKLMKAYNIQDTILLEKLYLRLRPFITNHPNTNILSRAPIACPKCGSTNLWKRGYNYTLTSEAQRFQCRECFGWCMGKPEKLALKVQVR
jgi:hypothetical protein